MVEKLTCDEVVEIKQYSQKLLSGKYFCGYNRLDADDYRKIIMCKYNMALTNALDAIGYDLVIDENRKTIYIKRQENVGSEKSAFDCFATKTVLLLVKKFMSELRKIDTGNTVFYKWNNLISDASAFIKCNSDKKKMINTLWRLKDMGLINVNTTKDKMSEPDADDRVAIEIYPSIMCVCNLKELEEVEEKLSALVYTNETIENVEENEIDE
jgi:hypothetical protein